jgi:hypothetical protein
MYVQDAWLDCAFAAGTAAVTGLRMDPDAIILPDSLPPLYWQP